jgi:hypothetical protein
MEVKQPLPAVVGRAQSRLAQRLAHWLGVVKVVACSMWSFMVSSAERTCSGNRA